MKGEAFLSGLTVLDLGDAKGSFCGRILADLGADVIKVEPPGGDPARNTGPFFRDEPHLEKSLSWLALNANKRGITLDLESPKGRDLFTRLVERAEFVVESFPPGYMKELGLDYARLRELNRHLVMTSISPFGQEGPYCSYKASDLVVMAMGGWVFICGDEDRPPVRFSIDQADLHAGAQAAVGTLIAHYHRGRTREGQHVEVSAQEAVLWHTTYPVWFWHSAQRLFPRAGSHQRRINVTYRRIYPCKDGYVSYQVGGGAMLGPMQQRLVKLMDEEGMAGDMNDQDWKSLSFETLSQGDVDRWEETLLRYFSTKTKAELQALAVANDLFLCPVNDIKEVYEYPQLASRGYWKPIRHDELGVTFQYPGFLFMSNLFSPGPRRRAPLIGEHNEEIWIAEMGFSGRELETWEKEGII